jgi:hypothetical protein
MNISDVQVPKVRFTAEALRVPDPELADIRMKIYHSTGDGYYIFRNFISPAVVKHLRDLWSGVDPVQTHHKFTGNECIYFGCPDSCAQYEAGNTIFYNFLFAEPLDEVTREVAVCVHMLRNRLSGRNAFSDLNGPHTAVSYRVIINKNYEEWIAPHRDYLEYERRLEKGQYDPSRLQATLFLSKKGEDYDGTAFTLERNDGTQAVFGTDVPVEPGDLVIWKYSNLHGVSHVTTPPGKLGLMRIIFPIYELKSSAGSAVQSATALASSMPYSQLLKEAMKRGVSGVLRRVRSLGGR